MSVHFKKIKLWQSLAKIKPLLFPSLKDPSAIYELSPECERLRNKSDGKWKLWRKMNVNLCNPLKIWVRAVDSFIIQMVVEDCHQWLCVSGQCSSSRRAFAPALLRGWVRARAWHRPVPHSSNFRTGSPARVRKIWLSRRINIFNSRLPSGIYRVDFITAPHDLFPTRET